jgi:hypothetical protein
MRVTKINVARLATPTRMRIVQVKRHALYCVAMGKMAAIEEVQDFGAIEMTVGLSPEIVTLRMAFPNFAEPDQLAMLHATVRTIAVEE